MLLVFVFLTGLSEAMSSMNQILEVHKIYDENGKELVPIVEFRKKDFSPKIKLRTDFATEISLSVKTMRQFDIDSSYLNH
jgi:hypothetical protein